jgi:hypothetical protein
VSLKRLQDGKLRFILRITDRGEQPALIRRAIDPVVPKLNRYLHSVSAFVFAPRSPVSEIALVLLRSDHVASVIVNVDHGIM